jgi:plasmid maintenance system antidote protein VapI
MYIWKFKNLCIRNQQEAGQVIGVTPQYICYICGRKNKINKRLAYFIVKYIDENAEVEDFFEKVD